MMLGVEVSPVKIITVITDGIKLCMGLQGEKVSLYPLCTLYPYYSENTQSGVQLGHSHEVAHWYLYALLVWHALIAIDDITDRKITYGRMH